jgi:hypothetical protein
LSQSVTVCHNLLQFVSVCLLFSYFQWYVCIGGIRPLGPEECDPKCACRQRFFSIVSSTPFQYHRQVLLAVMTSGSDARESRFDAITQSESYYKKQNEGISPTSVSF